MLNFYNHSQQSHSPESVHGTKISKRKYHLFFIKYDNISVQIVQVSILHVPDLWYKPKQNNMESSAEERKEHQIQVLD